MISSEFPTSAGFHMRTPIQLVTQNKHACAAGPGHSLLQYSSRLIAVFPSCDSFTLMTCS